MAAAATDEKRNAAARAAWITRGIRGVRALAPAVGQLGGTVRVKLDPVGMLTALIVRATCRVTITGTVQTPGNQSPFSLLTRLRLQDDQGTNRIVMTGDQAYALAALYDRSSGVGQAGVMYQYPALPTAIGVDQLIDVTYRLPIVGDPWRDLRGGLYMPKQSQTYLFCDFAPQFLTANDDTAVYKTTSGAVALSTATQQPTIEVWQEFLDSGEDVPRLDLATVHYLTGAQAITSGLAANGEQLIDYPVQRQVRALMLSQLVNQQMDIVNAGSMRSVIRSNYDSLEMTGTEKFVQQRRYLNGNDLRMGYWFFTHAPEVTSRFSREYQAGFTPAITGTTQSLNFLFDSFGS
jgi:hypothetical protein